MKIVMVALIGLALASNFEFTITQYNMMYHFTTLTTNQFPYVVSEYLGHEVRLKNNIATFNNMMADIMMVVEWNGNIENPYYIDKKDVLKKKLQEILASKGVTLDLSGAIPSLENFKKFADQAADNETDKKAAPQLKQDLIDRFITIQNIDNFKIFDEEKYSFDVTQKRAGQWISGGKPQDFKIDEPVAKTAEDLMQSMFFLYNKNVFEEVGTKQVFGTKIKPDDTKLETQNFMVRHLKHKASQKSFIVIGSHFKSKADGFEWRKRLGVEISLYLKNLKEEFKDANLIMLGDLNAEVTEIAYDLDIKIIRLEDQTQKLHGYAYSKVYSPRSQLSDLRFRIAKAQNLIKSMTDFYSVNEGSKDENFDTSVKKIQAEISWLEEKKAGLESYKVDDLDYWVEVNNFPTEKKIRINEIDFDAKAYNDLLDNLIQLQKESSYLNIGCLNDISTKKFEMDEKSQKNLSAYDLSIKSFQYQQRRLFLHTITCLREAIASEWWISRWIFGKFAVREKYLKALFDSLLEAEKIDFTLLHFRSDYTIVQVEKVPNYDSHLEIGAPNKDLASDHFPTRVTLRVENERSFQIPNIQQREVEIFELSPEVESAPKRVFAAAPQNII